MNPDRWPWRELPTEVLAVLEEEGLEDARALNELTDTELLDIKGIGPGRLSRIREVFLGPSGPRSKHGDVLLPNPSGSGYMAPPGPSNRGGTGRPRNELRAQLREILELAQDEQMRRLRVLRDSVGPQMSDEELRRLIDTAAKYGIGTRHTVGLDVEQLTELMRRLGLAVRTHVLDKTIDDREEILRRIEADWRDLSRSEDLR